MSNEKLKSAMHYVISKTGGTALGALRLNKIIFFSETESFDALGRSITKAKFIKRNQGPMVDWFYEVVAEMAADHLIAAERPAAKFETHNYSSLTQPDMSDFSPDEIAILDRAIEKVCNESTSAVSQRTHNQVWDMAADGDYLPVGGYFSAKTTPTPAHIANSLAQDLEMWERYGQTS